MLKRSTVTHRAKTDCMKQASVNSWLGSCSTNWAQLGQCFLNNVYNRAVVLLLFFAFVLLMTMLMHFTSTSSFTQLQLLYMQHIYNSIASVKNGLHHPGGLIKMNVVGRYQQEFSRKIKQLVLLLILIGFCDI